jgi:histidinol dehydrogenase
MKIWQSHEDRAARYVARLEGRFCEVFSPQVEERVRKVITAVRRQGDKALASLVRRYDLRDMKVGDFHLKGTVAPDEEVGEEFTGAVEHVLANLQAFHEPQMPKGYTLDHENGNLAIRVRPLESVGVYVPGGAAVYVSSLLMAVVPARIAGVPRIAVATPPRAFLGSPELRYVLDRLDLHEIYLMGGAHALAALAFGTDSVTPVDKIVGPGGRWVSAAKRALYGMVDVDLIAGPSEIVIVADGHAEPDIVAADLLAQAEHDPDALACVLTTSKALAEKVSRRVTARLKRLAKDAAARAAIKRWGAIIVVPDLQAAAELTNRIAPEHVELLVDEPRALLDAVERAGAVHLGPWSPVVLGDYVAGSNHVLPTASAARFASPLGVWDFVRRSTVVEVVAHRFPHLARTARALAVVENLPLHAEALAAGKRGAL